MKTITSVIAEDWVTNPDCADLADFEQLTDEAAKALARHTGDYLPLGGLTTLSAEAALSLAQYTGGLALDGLTTISLEVAEPLSRHRGDYLSLDGLTAVTDEVAKLLASYSGILYLNGLTTLSDKAVDALAQHKGAWLFLNGLRAISAEAIITLRRHNGRLSAEKLILKPEGCFQLSWCCLGITEPIEVRDPRILITNAEGISAENIANILNACREQGNPLVVVAPGFDTSLRHQSSQGDFVAIAATDLPGQSLDSLLADLAWITDGFVLHTDLGFGLVLPESLDAVAGQHIKLPNESWDTLPLSQLSRVNRIVVGPQDVQFECKPLTSEQRRNIQMRVARLLTEQATVGRDERVRRLCDAGRCEPGKVQVSSSLAKEFSSEYEIGLASPYFVTDPSVMECRLEDVCVAVIGEPLTDLECLVRLLGKIAAAGCPLLLAAPSVSKEALAICVVNRLRGIVSCAIAIPRPASVNPGPMLAELASRAGTQVLRQADLCGDDALKLPGKSATVRITRDGITFMPAQS